MNPFFEKIKKEASQRNFFPKAASLILALLLWAYIAGTRAGELKFRVPVKVRAIPASMAVSYMSDKYVTVLLEGKKENLRNINTKAIQAYVDVQSPRIGESKKYKIHFSAYELPENISVKLVSENVSMIVERKVEKAVRVVPLFSGSFRSGFTSGKTTVVPEYVTIQGPRSFIDAIPLVYTEDVSVNDEADDFVREVELNRDLYPEITFSQNVIKLQVPVVKTADLAHVDLPIAVMNVDPAVTFSAATASVRVYFDAKLAGKFGADGMSASVDAGGIPLKKILSTLHRGEMEIDLPVKITNTKNSTEINMVKFSPEAVRIKIRTN